MRSKLSFIMFLVVAATLIVGSAIFAHCYAAYSLSADYSVTEALCPFMPFLCSALMGVIVMMAAPKMSRNGGIQSVIVAALCLIAFVSLAVGLSIMTSCYMAYSAFDVISASDSLVVMVPFISVALACLAGIACVRPSKVVAQIRVK